ncbi:MAG: GNAT family N-acetyltransferase [Bacteroidales bacterium]|jgi:ribosomal protein S18 acetylase RimI-like enzyme|nr:GNAT family N-acetyltransferase [Bacteroidales bacterium]
MSKIELIRITNPNNKTGKEALQIYEEAFPVEEKRPIEKHIKLMQENSLFRFYAAMKGQKVIGMLVVWELSDFIYIDYLATSPNHRNKGYGKMIMEQLQQSSAGLMVLEVEMPDCDLAKRRIEFYTRLGFNLLDFPYFMPKYNNPNEPYPMLLMSFPNKIDNDMCKHVMTQIHLNAYNAKV